MISNLMIVIINLDLKDDTIALIQSLIQAGAKPEQIIVIDNGSTDDSVLALRGAFDDRLILVENRQNLGFTGGNNLGFDMASRMGAEWVLLLNNDTLVAADFFDQFEQAIKIDPSYHILSPVIFYHSKPDVIWHMGSRIIPGTLLARNLYHGKNMPKNVPLLLPVDFISGCAMFIHNEVYEKIGLFDPAFFIYWEEVDFCYRARRAGYQLAVITRAKMWHKISSTTNKDLRHYLNTRNMIYYTRKHASGVQKPIMRIYLLYRLVYTIIESFISNKRSLIRPILNGWRDGWRNPTSEKQPEL